MGFWNWIGGGRGTAECPYEPLALDEVHQRARRAEPAIAMIDPAQRLEPLLVRMGGDPSNPAAIAAVGACQLALGDYDQGMDHLNKASFLDKDVARVVRIYRIRGTTLDFYLDEPDKAVQHYDNAAKLDPRHAPLAAFRAELALRNGNHRVLKRLLAKLVKTGLTGPLGDAEAALHAKDHGAAFDALQVYHRISLLEMLSSP